MSIRVKAALVIISIVFVFTIANYLLNLSFTRKNIIEAMEQELTLARDIGEGLVSTEIKLIKTDTEIIAERLFKTGTVEGMLQEMAVQIDLYKEFISLTVYDRNGIVAHCGESITHDIFLEEKHFIEAAFNGETSFSPTHYNKITGAFIMHISVPMAEGLVLSATLPGMLFADFISGYRLWETGNIFLVDMDGTVIAHYRDDYVLKRINFITAGETMQQYRDIGNFFRKMISTDSGSGIYFLDGTERLCTYKRVSNSTSGWYIAVSAPVDKSPATKMQRDLAFSSLFFMFLGVLVAVFVSGTVVRPFYRIEAQNRDLGELSESVRAASEAKSRFLANMSHEMRTPLNAIIGLSELTIEDGSLNKADLENLEKIYSAGTTLLFTVNDILDISKIEAGKLELIHVDYDMPSLVNDSVTQNILRRGEKPIEFILEIDEHMFSRLNGDELRIKQIINNLLSNAFKYTKEGTIVLAINCKREGDDVWLTISVRDTGIGIKQEDIERLFSDYSQLDMRKNRKIEGTGLGLSITKKMTEMMGGSITVESEYGKGSVFTVHFKQKFVTEETIGKEVVNNLKNFRYSDNKRTLNSRLSRINLSYAHVLLVDDTPTNLDVAKGMLKPYGMQIDCASSGREAIAAVRNGDVKYNAIFMDHMMPEMNGIEAAKIIREEIGTEYAKTVPIIALTANAVVGNEELFLNNGFQAFVSKPIEIERLDAVIRQWIRDKELEKKLVHVNVNGQSIPDTRKNDRRVFIDRRRGFDRRTFGDGISGIDIPRGLDRFGGDEDSYIKILHSYINNTKPLLETMKEVNRDNLANYAITVHGIKGSSRGIFAGTVGSKAESLENAAKAGDLDFVSANNSAFIELTEKLIGDLEQMLKKMNVESGKARKDKPDNDALARLLAACQNYDMDGVDAAMEEIDAYEYESDEGLVSWLRVNVEQMNFTQIRERLA